MSKKILKILWIVIILLFIGLQIYHLIKANYADVITSLLTVIIILAMIIAYWLIARGKDKKEEKKSIAEKPQGEEKDQPEQF